MHMENTDSSSSSSSYSSSDDEIILRRPKIYKIRIENFNNWLDDEFFHRFRLSKEAVIHLLGLIREAIESPSNRGGAIKAETKLLLTLRFYATGNILQSVSDFIGVSVASASRIVKTVSQAIASLKPQFIQMPYNRNELEETVRDLHRICRFPRCCGAVDCTHIKILSPGGDDAEIFRNRKGYFSFNVQTVSDASLKIRNIVARWPGSCHDQTIFNNSSLKQDFENGRFGRFHLIGDSGYALRRYLYTPLQAPNNEAERLYNESLIRTRNVVERQYGVWKRRFPILSLGIKVDLNTAMTIIIATAVLHNMAIEMNEEELPGPLFEVDMEIFHNENLGDDNILNREARLIFINENFNL